MDQQSERPTCATCPYWDGNDEDDEANEGYCRRLPPVVSDASVVDFARHRGESPLESILSAAVAIHPTTHRKCWCGEHPDFLAWIKATQAS